MTTKLPFLVDFYGSNPAEENDDCWYGSEFASLEDARAFYVRECRDRDVAFVTLQGPGVDEQRANPFFRPIDREAEDRAERHERAFQAGMMGGCDAYNEALGYDLESPED